MTYIETSALDAVNIEKAFRDITTGVYFFSSLNNFLF